MANFFLLSCSRLCLSFPTLKDTVISFHGRFSLAVKVM